MSAYLVSDRHIDALITYARSCGEDIYLPSRNRINPGIPPGADALGKILRAENHRAVVHRYGEKTPPAPDYRFRPYPADLAPIQILKACACLAYQLAEPDDWETTDAMRIIRAVEKMAIRRLAGWEMAGWEISA